MGVIERGAKRYQTSCTLDVNLQVSLRHSKNAYGLDQLRARKSGQTITLYRADPIFQKSGSAIPEVWRRALEVWRMPA